MPGRSRTTDGLECNRVNTLQPNRANVKSERKRASYPRDFAEVGPQRSQDKKNSTAQINSVGGYRLTYDCLIFRSYNYHQAKLYVYYFENDLKNCLSYTCRSLFFFTIKRINREINLYNYICIAALNKS